MNVIDGPHPSLYAWLAYLDCTGESVSGLRMWRSSNGRHDPKDSHMTKKAVFFAVLVLALSTVAPLHAQFGGCVDSPETPTLILAGLASGAFAVSSLRTRMRARRAVKNTPTDLAK